MPGYVAKLDCGHVIGRPVTWDGYVPEKGESMPCAGDPEKGLYCDDAPDGLVTDIVVAGPLDGRW